MRLEQSALENGFSWCREFSATCTEDSGHDFHIGEHLLSGEAALPEAGQEQINFASPIHFLLLDVFQIFSGAVPI